MGRAKLNYVAGLRFIGISKLSNAGILINKINYTTTVNG